MKIIEKAKEALTMLNLFSFLELLGFVGFIAIMVYCIVHSDQIVASGDILKNPLTIKMVSFLAVGIVGFLVSNKLEDLKKAT